MKTLTSRSESPFLTRTAAVLAGLLLAGVHSAAEAAAPKAKATPTAIADSGGRVYIFVTDATTGNVQFKMRGAGIPAPSFSAWQNLGGVNAGKVIAAVSAAQNRIVIFVRGTDNGIWANWQTSAGSLSFNGWSRLWGATAFATDPVVVKMSDGRLKVFAATASDAVYNSWQSDPLGPFSTSWSSLGTVPLTPSSGPDLAVARSPGGRIVLTAGTKYRSQPGNGGTWTSWRDFTDTSFKMDHVALVATSQQLYAVGLDYYCDHNCQVRISAFDPSTWQFDGSWDPGGANPGYAYLSPIAVGSIGTAALVGVMGTDARIWFQPAAHCFPLNPDCPPFPWLSTGPTPGGLWPTPPSIAVTPDITYIVMSISQGATYYQLFWHDTFSLSGGWVQP